MPTKSHNIGTTASSQARVSYVMMIVTLVLTACSGAKFIPEGEALYTDVEIRIRPIGKVSSKKILASQLEEKLLPKPNKSILGMRPGIWFYYKAGNPKKEKGFRNFIKKKFGQAPVLIGDVDPKQKTSLLKGMLYNQGFFDATVNYEVRTKRKKSKVIYTAAVRPAYRLRNIDYPKSDVLFENIDTIKSESYLKPDQPFNLERLQAEQTRIEETLENFGFFFFDDRHLLFDADSTVGKRQVDLALTLERGVPQKAKRIYALDRIYVYPDFTLGKDTVSHKTDTLYVNGYHYFDAQKNFRPNIITGVINLRPGNIYRREDREFTISHLMSLGVFKFVNIKFYESPRDSTLLNASIYLTQLYKKSIRAEMQAVSKSNNFVGPGLTLSYTDRNIFKGAEKFDISLNTAYEVQVSRQQATPLNAVELGLESSLSVPRFISPFRIYYPSRKYLPTTKAILGFRLQKRIQFFQLNSFHTSFGYTWRENTLKTHELYPVDINFVHLGRTSAEFDFLLQQNPLVRNSFQDQFILGARYAYTLNTQLNEQREEKFRIRNYSRSHFYFNGNADIAGNLVHLLQAQSLVGESDQQPLTLFGSVYSQYARGDIDFRYYWRLDKHNTFASRLVGGIGYAYGNSTTLPYIKQFSSGGSNSIRAFPARSIGPGTYDVRSDPSSENRKLFIDQRGDIRLEANAEWRHDITPTLKGAVFLDAGNIWLIRNDINRPGGRFNRSTFMDEFAVGTGVGLRLDFNFFVLRFDLAFPIRKPYLPENERWVMKQIDFSSPGWRRDNLVLNIAIGYPF